MNFNNDSKQIETFPLNCFYFQVELVWNRVLPAAKGARIFRDLDRKNQKRLYIYTCIHTYIRTYIYIYVLNETTEVSEMFHKCVK